MLRRLAVEADVDPRTIRKLLSGQEVRGMAGRRARNILIDAGLLGGTADAAIRSVRTGGDR